MNPPPIIDCEERHLNAILAIWNDAIISSTVIYDYVPRTPDMVAQWFQQKRQSGRPLIGIEDARGQLAAFATYSAFRPFPAYKYTVEHSIYVEKSQRNRGLGAHLMRALLDRATKQGLHVLIGVIDSANEGSIRFHQRFGFQPCGQIKQVAWKFNRWLDADFYQLVLPTPDKPVEG
jgi:phosphinothricin acetyltransferase